MFCPPLKRYDAGFQTRVAIEIAAARKEATAAGREPPAWTAMIDDYGSLRDQCRAINGERR